MGQLLIPKLLSGMLASEAVPQVLESRVGRKVQLRVGTEHSLQKSTMSGSSRRRKPPATTMPNHHGSLTKCKSSDLQQWEHGTSQGEQKQFVHGLENAFHIVCMMANSTVGSTTLSSHGGQIPAPEVWMLANHRPTSDPLQRRINTHMSGEYSQKSVTAEKSEDSACTCEQNVAHDFTNVRIP